MADHHPHADTVDDHAVEDAVHEARPAGRTEMPAGDVEPAAVARALRDNHSALCDRARQTVAAWGFPPVDDTIDRVIERRLTNASPDSDGFDLFAVAADWAGRQLDHPEEWLDDEARLVADTAIREHLTTEWLWNDTSVIDTVTGWIAKKLREKNRPELPWEDRRNGVVWCIAQIHRRILHKWSRDQLNGYFVTPGQDGFPAWDDERLPSFIAAYADNRAFDRFNPTRTERRRHELHTEPVDPGGHPDPDPSGHASLPLGDRPRDRPLFPHDHRQSAEDVALAAYADPEALANELRRLWPAAPPRSPHGPELAPDEQDLLDEVDAQILALAIHGHTPDQIAKRLTTPHRPVEPEVVTSRIVLRCGQRSCVAHGHPGNHALRNSIFNDESGAALATAVVDYLSRWPELADYADGRKWDVATFARVLAVRVTQVDDEHVDENFTPSNLGTMIDRVRDAIPALGQVFHTLLHARDPARATTATPPRCPCEQAST